MHETPCPKCGHCPTCGRSNAPALGPYTQPWRNPFPTMAPPTWINGFGRTTNAGAAPVSYPAPLNTANGIYHL